MIGYIGNDKYSNPLPLIGCHNINVNLFLITAVGIRKTVVKHSNSLFIYEQTVGTGLVDIKVF